nr:branched-chain amino acid ABC transporter, substrate-binding protein [uncultured bacterium]BAH90478.1 branched-chain amino acid ABC transporter, substrate-binding protein [uncultured bacterium]
MMKLVRVAAVALIATMTATSAMAETVKVGIIAPFSGPFAIWGKQFQEAIEVYQAQHGTSVGDNEIELIYKDSGGPNPDQAKALAQELLVREQVDYIGGLVFTPNALAIAPLIDRAEKPAVIFNAATSMITTQSEFFIRTGFTLWQVTVPVAEWAYDQGMRKVSVAVTDYGPGLDAAAAFKKAFEAKGGEIVDEIRMPITTTDFAPFMQRVKDQAPDAVFGFLPVGPPTFAFTKSYNENGLRDAGITFLGTGETDETTLDALGDAALGLTTAYHYSAAHDSEMNKAFTAKLAELHPDSVANLASVGAYDGMEAIYRMVEAAGKDGPAAIEAIKGASWESPRGPITIDAELRHVTQNVYLREVAKTEDGKYINREFQTIEAVPDLGLSMAD